MVTYSPDEIDKMNRFGVKIKCPECATVHDVYTDNDSFGDPFDCLYCKGELGEGVKCEILALLSKDGDISKHPLSN